MKNNSLKKEESPDKRKKKILTLLNSRQKANRKVEAHPMNLENLLNSSLLQNPVNPEIP